MNYREVFSYMNLYNSFLKARKGKRDQDEVINYSIDLEYNLHKLHNSLMKKEYKEIKYYHFTIYEPKKREIQAIYFEDRIIEHCLCDYYLIPLLERHLIYDNGATRISKGTDFNRRRIKEFINLYYLRNKTNMGYVLKFDIHHYFPSINHNILKEKMVRLVDDEDILKLIFFIIDSYHEDGDINKGIPIGNQTSQCFALFYLDEIDRLIKEVFKMKYYSRYMDDGIVISNSLIDLNNLLVMLKLRLKYLDLTLNPKTKILKLNKGFNYLGFKYILLKNGKILQLMSKDKRNRLIRHIKKKRTNNEDINIEFYEQYLRRGNNYKLLEKIKKM